MNPWTGLPIFDATAVNRGAVEVADDADPDDELEEFERDEQRDDVELPNPEEIDSQDAQSTPGEGDRSVEQDDEQEQR